mmetsp:Transcript_40628/g.80057  ORF Transcript_40628/g.80057 Transcript_40628/m.80057 type:complete len:226 (-) Transcript_40628:902-1579(-)
MHSAVCLSLFRTLPASGCTTVHEERERKSEENETNKQRERKGGAKQSVKQSNKQTGVQGRKPMPLHASILNEGGSERQSAFLPLISAVFHFLNQFLNSKSSILASKQSSRWKEGRTETPRVLLLDPPTPFSFFSQRAMNDVSSFSQFYHAAIYLIFSYYSFTVRMPKEGMPSSTHRAREKWPLCLFSLYPYTDATAKATISHQSWHPLHGAASDAVYSTPIGRLV